MSLCASYSPQLGLSGSFGSLQNVTELEKETLQKGSRKHFELPGERSSLVYGDSNGHYDGTKSNEEENDMPSKTQVRLTRSLLRTVAVVTIGSSLQFGYATGVMNNSEDIIMNYFHNHGKEYTLVGWGTTVSCYGIGGLIGAILGPKVLGHFFGRRATLLVNNVFLVLSSILIAWAPVWWYQAMGRILVGIVAGVATAVVPSYFSEISPISMRGAIGTMHQLGITVGILLSQALSTPSLHLLGSEERWQWLFLVPVLCGVIEIIFLPFCPESPSYLYKTKGKGAARESIVALLSEDVADEYIGYIEEEIVDSVSIGADGTRVHSMSIAELFWNCSLRKQLIVGIAVQLMMQFSGIDAVFYYSTTVFKQAGVYDPELATTLLGVINVVVTIFAVKYMDTAGRKSLLTYSWIGMFASFSALTASFVFKPYLAYMDQLSVISTTGVIVFFAFGPGCIAWFIIAEIFPLHARDSAMALGIFINWIANWLVAFTFPLLLEYTQPYTFLVFVASTGFFLWFTRRFVPETKGRTIVQVTKLFEEIPL